MDAGVLFSQPIDDALQLNLTAVIACYHPFVLGYVCNHSASEIV